MIPLCFSDFKSFPGNRNFPQTGYHFISQLEVLTAAQLNHPAHWQRAREGTIAPRRPHRGLEMSGQALFVRRRLWAQNSFKRHQNHQLLSQLILYVTEHISWWLASQHFTRIELCRGAWGNLVIHTRDVMGIYYQDDFNGKLAQKVVTHEFS